MCDIKVCRICLRSSNIKLYGLTEFNLQKYYEELRGQRINVKDGLPCWFCYQCAALLHKFHKFKEKLIYSQKAFKKLQKSGLITHKSINNIISNNENILKFGTLDIVSSNDKVKTFKEKHFTINPEEIKDGDKNCMRAEEVVFDSYDYFYSGEDESYDDPENDPVAEEEKVEINEDIEDKKDILETNDCGIHNPSTLASTNEIELPVPINLDSLKVELKDEEPLEVSKKLQHRKQKVYSQDDDDNDDIEDSPSGESTSVELTINKPLVASKNLRPRKQKVYSQDDNDDEKYDDSPIDELNTNKSPVVSNKLRRKKQYAQYDDDNDEDFPEVELKIKEPLVETKKRRRKKKKVYSSPSSDDEEEYVEVQPKRKVRKTNVISPETKKYKFKSKNGEVKAMAFLNSGFWKKTSLSEEQALKEFEARSRDRKYLNAAFKCTDCIKGFSKKVMLDRHKLLRHGEAAGPLTCRFCNMRFKSSYFINKHMRQHYTKYECLRCNLVCNLENSALFHEEYHNGVIRKCTHCDKEFRHMSSFYTHLRTHRSKHMCSLCGESFVSELGLRLHKNLKHAVETVSRMSGSKPRKRGSTWDEDSLRCAMEAVQTNQLSTNAAAVKFNIPRRTLRNRLLTGNTAKVIGKSSLLTKQLEEELAQQLKRFTELAIPLTPKFIRKQAFLYCERLQIKHSFNMSTRMAGRKWLKMFLRRNPSISKRNPHMMNPARTEQINKPIVKHHFEELKKPYQELDVVANPEILYNMDEKGCRITVHKQNVVLAEKENTRVHLVDTGLYPLDPDAIPKDANAPSVITERPLPETFQGTPTSQPLLSVQVYQASQFNEVSELSSPSVLHERRSDNPVPCTSVSRMSGSKPRKRGSTWNEDSLRCAMEAVQTNQLSTNAAAIKFNIPRRTLRNHLLTGNTTKVIGKSSLLTKQLEEDLVQRIKRFAELGITLTPKFIQKQVFLFCERFKIKHSFNMSTRMAGRKWLKMFLRRNPSISKINPQIVNPARAQKINKPIVKLHFKELKKLYQELDIVAYPERLYNMDEKGCPITVHKQNVVLAKKGNTGVHLVAPEHAENVTIAMCVNAVGSAVPPMIIFKGVIYKSILGENLPAGTKVRMTPKGSMTSSLFVEFIQHLAQHKAPGKCLLIFDGAKCHLSYEALEEADKNNIVLYCLPSNTTHELQPLDKSVNRSFEQHWDEEVLNYLCNPLERSLNKAAFNHIFSRTWPKCMTQTNIINGFRDTGLYPLDPDAIPEDAYAPSVITERPLPETFQGTPTSQQLISVQVSQASQLNEVSELSSPSVLHERRSARAFQISSTFPVTSQENIVSSSPSPFHDLSLGVQYEESEFLLAIEEIKRTLSSSSDASDTEIDNTINDQRANTLLSSVDRLNDEDTNHDPQLSLYDNPVPCTSGLQKKKKLGGRPVILNVLGRK